MRPRPTLDEIVTTGIESFARELWTATIGYVVSYDAATRAADVQPAIKREVPGVDGKRVFESFPILPAVPCLFLGGGGWRVTFKPTPSDAGLLIVCTSDIASWLAGDGKEAEPKDAALHHPAHAVFIPGLTPFSASVPAAQEDAFVIGTDGAQELRLRSHTAVDHVTNDTLLQAELAAIALAMSTATAPSGGGPVNYPDAYTPSDTKFQKIKGSD
jgi:hypothetical protein